MTKVSWMSYFMSCCGGNQPPRSKTSDRQPGSPCRLSLSDFSSCSMSLDDLSLSLVGSSLHVFSITELQTVTRNFSRSNFIGEGGFGRVYKGFIDDKLRPGLEAQTVAVKRLELEGTQGHNEWLAEVIFLGQLQHQHQVKLIGYCYEGKHRLLVYEYMSRGSLENHLFRMHTTPLPWLTRLKIAVGAAKGLAFLHEAEKPVIYRDFKASNILLDSDYNAKLSDFGLAKDGPEGDDTHVSTRIMGTPGYAAPDYIMSGHLTTKSDVYSFGVVLLELLTGRRSIDKTRSHRERDLVQWARPYLKNAEKLGRIIDPSLDGQYSMKAAEKAALVAYQCLSQYPKYRPHMRTIIEMLEPLLDLDDVPVGPFVYIVLMEKETKDNEGKTELASTESKGTSKQQKKMLDIEQEIKHQQCGDGRKLRSRISVPHSDTTLYKNSTRQQKETWRER